MELALTIAVGVALAPVVLAIAAVALYAALHAAGAVFTAAYGLVLVVLEVLCLLGELLCRIGPLRRFRIVRLFLMHRHRVRRDRREEEAARARWEELSRRAAQRSSRW